MRNPFVHAVGGVLSADIAVPDHERELDFYSKVLTTGDSPLWREDLMNNLGTPVIGLGTRTPEYDALPLQWMPHFQVADVAASVASTIELGGKALMVDDQNRWAVLSDQAGAAFGIIPVVDSEATQPTERFGCISWLSLTVPDAKSSREFYQRVVGWDNETAASAISQTRNEQDAIPSVWLIHLPVDDLAESLRRVSEGDGKVIEEFVEEKYVVVRDPAGVYFALRE